MGFSYYRRLGPRQRAIVRRSDAISALPLPETRLESLRALTAAIEPPLRADDRCTLERRAARFTLALLAALRVEPVGVRVHAHRPRSAHSELHGLYVREPGSRPLVHVWMRTAVRGQPVRYRTFLRTLLHEVCHHLDYTLLGLPDSFHTRGFYRRESSLMRQLLGAPRGRSTAPSAPAASLRPPSRSGYGTQLDLFEERS